MWQRKQDDRQLTERIEDAFQENRGCIIVRITARERTVEVSVQDFGIGISPSQHERIFERFYQATELATYPGLGIGLYIAREIVQRHGGDITVESEKGKGSTFLVSFPVRST